MKTKSIFLLLLFLTMATSKAQITNSLSVDLTSIYNYDGSYDPFSQGHLYYPNEGEVISTDAASPGTRDIVKFYTMYSAPKIYLMNNNNISLCYAKGDSAETATTAKDTLQRIDIEWQRSNSGAF